MRNTFLLLLMSAYLTNAFAQNSNDWENPLVFAINKEKSRPISLPYPSEQLAIENDYKSSIYYQSLNGKWNFQWFAKIGDIPDGFYKEKFNASTWNNMPVPGNWEFNGFGIPSFKDIINKCKADQWDPDYLVGLFKKAGAEYFVVLANHHDNFDLYYSRPQPWNSVRMGPKKDIVGGWAKAKKNTKLLSV